VQCGHFADKGEEGSSDADVRAFWSKNTKFSKFMVFPHGQRKGVEPVRTLSFMAAPNSKYSVLLLLRLFFTSNSAVFIGRSAKIFLPQGAGYPLATLMA